ncbi:MAG: hypothetical protein EHM50_01865, partial [Lysobacterales bacterium]
MQASERKHQQPAVVSESLSAQRARFRALRRWRARDALRHPVRAAVGPPPAGLRLRDRRKTSGGGVSAPVAASKHWRKTIDEDGVCWLTLDKAGATANTLSSDVLEELAHELDSIRAPTLRGLVFDSGKRSGFILGADVGEFSHLQDATQAKEMAARGQSLLGRIAALEVPTVAAIDGFALGGGLELALACDYRVAVDSYERTLG